MVHLKPLSISYEQLRGKHEAMTELKVELRTAKVSNKKAITSQTMCTTMKTTTSKLIRMARLTST